MAALLAKMVEAMTAIGSKSASTKKLTLTKPRLGGISVTGVWTGSGASGLSQEPNSTCSSEKRSFSKPEMVTNICVPDVYVTQI
jgi:hypothetical protein